MLVINIPKNVYEIDECLGYNIIKDNMNDDDNMSVSTQYSNINEQNIIQLFKEEKFVGDLVKPYEGIEGNCYSIHFVIYGINEEKINYQDWFGCKKNENTIEIVFDLSVF